MLACKTRDKVCIYNSGPPGRQYCSASNSWYLIDVYLPRDRWLCGVADQRWGSRSFYTSLVSESGHQLDLLRGGKLRSTPSVTRRLSPNRTCTFRRIRLSTDTRVSSPHAGRSKDHNTIMKWLPGCVFPQFTLLDWISPYLVAQPREVLSLFPGVSATSLHCGLSRPLLTIKVPSPPNLGS